MTPPLSLARGTVHRLALMTQQELQLGATVRYVRLLVQELAECHRVFVQLPGGASWRN